MKRVLITIAAGRTGRGLLRCWEFEGEATTIAGMKRTTFLQPPPASNAISYVAYRFPPDVWSAMRCACTGIFR